MLLLNKRTSNDAAVAKSGRGNFNIFWENYLYMNKDLVQKGRKNIFGFELEFLY